MKVSVVGIPWYREEDFVALRALFADGEKLHKTYGEWLAAALRLEEGFKERGMLSIRALIVPKEFRAWCDARELPLNAHARGEYASECAYHNVRPGKEDDLGASGN